MNKPIRISHALVPPHGARTHEPLIDAAEQWLHGLWVGLLLVGFALMSPEAQAQPSLVEKIGVASANVHEDNLDAAKSRALRLARGNAVQRYLGELVAAEWLELYQGELRRAILTRPDRYIASYRVHKLDPSISRTSYTVTVAAQINRENLITDLRRIALPIIGDEVLAVGGFYPSNDQALRNPKVQAKVLEELKKRLALLNMNLVGLNALTREEFDSMVGAQDDPAEVGQFLRKRRSDVGVLMEFMLSPRPETPAEGFKPGLELRFYRGITGASMGTFTTHSRQGADEFRPTSSRFPDFLDDQLVQPMLRRLQPASIQVADIGGDAESVLKLQVYGYQSMADEEAFEQAFFKSNSQFGKLALSRITTESVLYEGSFSGNRRRLEAFLPGKQFGEFRVLGVSWFNDVLEMQVERTSMEKQQEMKLLQAGSWPANLTQNLEALRKEFFDLTLADPEFMEVEDNGWLLRANRVPLEAVLYGQLDSREDTDYYMVEELSAGDTMRIGWYRMGRTNLSPRVRLFDENGKSVRILYPRNYVEVEYKIPKGQHRLFIQVSDRFGSAGWGAGGYQTAHYLFQISAGKPR